MLLKVQREIDRCRRVMRERVKPHILTPVADCRVTAVCNPGEPVPPRAFIQKAEAGSIAFETLPAGQPWGTSWGTTWMKVAGRIPESIPAGTPLELDFDLGWLDWPVGGHIEGMVYRPDGTAVKAIHPQNHWVPLLSEDGRADRAVGAAGDFTLYVEAAYNPNVPSFTPTRLGEGPTGRADQRYDFHNVKLCAYHQDIHRYWISLDVVSGAVDALDPGQPRLWKLAKAMQRSLNIYDGASQETIQRTLPQAMQALEGVMSAPADHSALRLSAMGHAHIDSAWLWPVRETKRKVGRTVANVLALLDRDPDFIYVMSSAQHYAWLEERHPDLFDRVKAYVRQGRFIPVGGMWVESDGMLPSGESLIRQISYGSRYFQEKFGIETHGIWLPDSFGYTGSWPQIARRSGCRWFLTQKLSWNDTSRLPHHSFMWEGIDGSRIFTHFPPADKYDSDMSPEDLHYAERNFKDKDLSDQAILLFGYGDGGGGPTREMAMRAKALHDFEGMPRVDYDTPDHFFDTAQADMVRQAGSEMPGWKGELYLELHRKTMTSQQEMKRGCRQEESWLRTAEYCCALAQLSVPDYRYPREELDRIWKTLLLNQFHDILPGSGIAWNYRVARKEYRHDIAALKRLVDSAGRSLHGRCPGLPVKRQVRIPQFVNPGRSEAPAWSPQPISGAQTAGAEDRDGHVILEQGDDGSVILDNGLLKVVITADGAVASVRDYKADREVVPSGRRLGQYEVLKDEPGVFDAWDVERDAFLSATALTGGRIAKCALTKTGAAEVHIETAYRSSLIKTVVTLRTGRRQLDFHAEVDWQVPEKLLKVDFPLAVQADRARYETQYGWVERPVAKNTPRDEAAFENCTHRFVEIKDSGYGVGVVNASTYGSDVGLLDDGTPEGSVGTMLRLTLVAAPTAPDPHADIGRHAFDWSLLPGTDMPGLLAAAAEINAPIVESFPDCRPPVSLETIEGTPVIDWMKMADDKSGDLIMRVYEAAGGRARARLRLRGPLSHASVVETDLLERVGRHYEGEPDALADAAGPGQGAEILLRPFQIATLRLSAGQGRGRHPEAGSGDGGRDHADEER